MAPLETVDISHARHKADPYPFYARLRAEAPICRVQIPPGPQEAWLVSRYADVSALLRDPRLLKDPSNALSPAELKRFRQPPAFLRPLTRNMLGLDDPDHARLKKLVQKAFTSRRIEAMAGRTQGIVDALLDDLQERPAFDLIEEYALPVPVAVISDMLGVPDVDRARFARWSRTLITTPQRPLRMLLAMPQILAFMSYLKWLVKQKRRQPADDLKCAGLSAQCRPGAFRKGRMRRASVL